MTRSLVGEGDRHIGCTLMIRRSHQEPVPTVHGRVNHLFFREVSSIRPQFSENSSRATSKTAFTSELNQVLRILSSSLEFVQTVFAIQGSFSLFRFLESCSKKLVLSPFVLHRSEKTTYAYMY